MRDGRAARAGDRGEEGAERVRRARRAVEEAERELGGPPADPGPDSAQRGEAAALLRAAGAALDRALAGEEALGADAGHMREMREQEQFGDLAVYYTASDWIRCGGTVRLKRGAFRPRPRCAMTKLRHTRTSEDLMREALRKYG